MTVLTALYACYSSYRQWAAFNWDQFRGSRGRADIANLYKRLRFSGVPVATRRGRDQ